jgi:hypothetical protein
MVSRLQRAASLSAAILLLASCIPIPYKPSATAGADASLAMSGNHIVSALPDPMTVALAKKIEARDATMKVVSLGEIAEVAFPDGDSTVEQLTDPERRTRLCSEAGLAYFVLVGELTSRELSKHGGFVPFLGAGTSTEATGLSAGIVDLERGQLLTGVSAVAKGRASGVVYGFYGIILTPMSETSVRDAVAAATVDAIRSAAGPGPVRIAIARVLGLQSSTCTEGEGCGSDDQCPEGGCLDGAGRPHADPLPR